MTFDLASRRIVAVHLDFDLAIEFDDRAVVAFSELTVGETLFDEDNQFEGLRALATYVDGVCVGVDVAPSGELTLHVAGKAALSAAPRESVESWEYTAHDGSTVICLPGGDIETVDAPIAHLAASTGDGKITESATAVRISVGATGGVQFSDGSALRMVVPLNDAYLILRESVVSARESDASTSVLLSSGQQLVGTR